jgi:hypothetical protein
MKNTIENLVSLINTKYALYLAKDDEEGNEYADSGNYVRSTGDGDYAIDIAIDRLSVKAAGQRLTGIVTYEEGKFFFWKNAEEREEIVPTTQIDTRYTSIDLTDKNHRWVNLGDPDDKVYHEVHSAIIKADADDYQRLWGIDSMSDEEIEAYEEAPEEMVSIWDGHNFKQWSLDYDTPQEELNSPEVLKVLDSDSDMDRDYALVRDKHISNGVTKYYYYLFISGYPRYAGLVAYNSITPIKEMEPEDFTWDWLQENGI